MRSLLFCVKTLATKIGFRNIESNGFANLLSNVALNKEFFAESK